MIVILGLCDMQAGDDSLIPQKVIHRMFPEKL